MALLSIFRGTQAECSARPVSDGTLLFATDTKKIYLDKDSSRIEMSSVDNLSNYVTKEQLTTALNGKANTTHTHTQDQVTGLKDALAGKASTSHSHSVASSSASGFMSTTDKQKLDGIAAGANKYTLPAASSTALGGMKIGYKESGKNYSVKLDDNNQAYVTVPWTDTTSELGIGYGTCTTAEATKAKVSFISNYTLTDGGIVAIKFSHAVPAGSTLNITSKGAKAIYYKGAAITNGIIKAGDTATFMYSTYYHLISIDRDAYTLPPATASTLGGVMVGEGLSVAADGELSVADYGNIVTRSNFSTILDETSRFFISAADETVAAIIGSVYGKEPSVFMPNTFINADIIYLAINIRWYLSWMNGTRLELAPLSFEIDTQTKAITLYARGRSSMVYGVAGVDTSWTITTLPTDVNVGGVVQAAGMPEYVKDAALEVARKVAAVQTSNTITFIAMSDAHDLLSNSDIRTGLQHAGMAAKAISYMVPLDFFFHGGDATMGSATTTLADGKAEIAEVNHWIDEAAEGVPNFRTPGNHDALRYNTGITPLTDAELYEYFGRYNADGTTVMGSTTAGYCHRDLTAKRVRIICLNTAEGGKENVSAAQQLWFCQTLAGVPSSYGVVILSHHPLDWGAINPCANILYQFKQKGSYTVSGTTVSFASVNPAYTVCFHGHVHDFLADRVNRVVNSQGAPFDVQRIAVPNVCFNRNNEYWQNGVPEYYGIEFGQPTTYNKTAGTANDTAFTVNVIDPTNELVHSFCYGAGVDRAVSIGATVYHMISLSLTHVTSSNASTAVEDGTAYTTTLAADSGYDMQLITVTMGGTDITSTAYNSSTGVVSIASATGTITITAMAIVHTSYTNLVPTAVDSSGNVVGYKDGYYVSGSGKVGDFSANASFVATGAMALPSGWQHIYVKGVPMLSGDSHERYYFGKADKTMPSNSGYYITATNYASASMTIETLDTNYYCISSTNTNTLAAAWVCMSFKTSTGANLIVTVDEPIE